MGQQPADEVYHDLLLQARDELHDCRDKLTRGANLRRCLVGLMVVSLALAAGWSDYREFALAAAGILMVGFIGAQIRILNLRSRKLMAQSRIEINQHGLARRTRNWGELPAPKIKPHLAALPLAVDLDLFGDASLMKLICTAETEDGIDTLCGWLVEPATATAIKDRQRAALELAGEVRWRQELQRRCRILTEHSVRGQALRRWSSHGTSFRLPHLARYYAVSLLVVVPFVLVLLTRFPSVGTILFAGMLLINFALTIAFSGNIHSFFRQVVIASPSDASGLLSGTFAHIGESTMVEQFASAEAKHCLDAARELRVLERILALEAISRHPLTTILCYFPLQLLFLWDLHVFQRCDRWRGRVGSQVEPWFTALGKVEALTSLAMLRFEQSQWCLPCVEDSDEFIYSARGLGHPLLRDEARVSNDVTIGPPGRLLLVTGSNMGGKSTLLRAIGLNAILAQAGAVVCCRDLRMPRLRVMTSMRVSDSLADSTSLFMAQLLQLRRITDQIQHQSETRNTPAVMYLFDEILNGTNTTDRRLAVEHLLGFLLRRRTIGAMTTHDLEIASESRYRESFDVYFLGHQLLGSAQEPRIEFDYRLRPGIAPRGSATALIRLLGLPPGS